MARNTFALKLDVADLVRRSGRLDRFTGEHMAVAAVETLNDVVDAVYEEARNRMNTGTNLDDGYMQRRMAVEHASAARPVATLLARGDKKSVTGLSHYGVQQRVQPVANRPARSKGDPARGIPRGSKTAGVTAEVTRGGRKNVRRRSVFLMPGTADTESGNMLVFERVGGTTRSGKDKLRRLLGPSVYQLFRYQLEHGLLEETNEALSQELGDKIQEALRDALK